MNYDIQLQGIYVNQKETDVFPKKDSGVTFDKILCSNDASASFDSVNWAITIGNLTNVSQCRIYFSETKPSYMNPATGTFVNIFLILSIVAVSVFAIRRIIKKNKFYKI